MLEKGCIPIIPYDTIQEDLVYIHPTENSLNMILDKAIHHANRCMQESSEYSKERWDKSHKPPGFNVGDLVLSSTLSFNNIEGPEKKIFLFRNFHYNSPEWP
ncbi:hypothetical protein O181_021341 [Austropuccinia psidii MF-1]|uniref:Uncharacterized protein n=1 Tax=Austropuccinia psidii MF-1 TaxID=1389203 RepID=A0A9Q3CFB1_9BASI|nr:hypothetical protein [Austropuccinia psidii MF-1]